MKIYSFPVESTATSNEPSGLQAASSRVLSEVKQKTCHSFALFHIELWEVFVYFLQIGWTDLIINKKGCALGCFKISPLLSRCSHIGENMTNLNNFNLYNACNLIYTIQEIQMPLCACAYIYNKHEKRCSSMKKETHILVSKTV